MTTETYNSQSGNRRGIGEPEAQQREPDVDTQEDWLRREAYGRVRGFG